MTHFDFDNPPSEPLPSMQAWMEDAVERAGTPNPNAMSLATIDPDGRPSVRVVLMRGLDERGVVFFTNRTSRKGDALRVHPRAAVVFHWDALERQIRVEGDVTETTDAESDAYWATRPRESQLAAWTSEQSHPVANRAVLEERYERYQKEFADGPVPRPPFWGGYRIALERVEIWEGKRARLHDRVIYVRQDDTWKVERLCP